MPLKGYREKDRGEPYLKPRTGGEKGRINQAVTERPAGG